MCPRTFNEHWTAGACDMSAFYNLHEIIRFNKVINSPQKKEFLTMNDETLLLFGKFRKKRTRPVVIWMIYLIEINLANYSNDFQPAFQPKKKNVVRCIVLYEYIGHMYHLSSLLEQLKELLDITQ